MDPDDLAVRYRQSRLAFGYKESGMPIQRVQVDVGDGCAVGRPLDPDHRTSLGVGRVGKQVAVWTDREWLGEPQAASCRVLPVFDDIYPAMVANRPGQYERSLRRCELPAARKRRRGLG